MSRVFTEELIELTLEAMVDEALELKNEIEEMKAKYIKVREKKYEILKERVFDQLKDMGKEEATTEKGSAKIIERNGKKFDIDRLFEDYKIDDSVRDSYVTKTLSTYVQLYPKKV